MISYLEARKMLVDHTRPMPVMECPIQESLGCVVASDLRSPVSLPHFHNSAMDGFVLASRDTRQVSSSIPIKLKIAGVIKAGSSKCIVLKRGSAHRIMTGAPLPSCADAVLEKEKATVQDGFLMITEPVEKGWHVRMKSEEIMKGSRVDLKGTTVTPGVVGFLSSLGLKRIRVFQRPCVSLIATGDEVKPCGKVLRHGEIYDSNTPMVLAALKSLRIPLGMVKRVTDRKRTLEMALSKAIQRSHIVILTGGVSVGDYDHVKTVFKEAGVQTIFWKVNQKPGKPVFFGRKRRVLIFGLPGNPASVHACFYEYVYPAIRRLMGHQDIFLREENLPITHEIKPDLKKTLFFKAQRRGFIKTAECEALRHQGSHMLSSLCRSSGFIVVPPGNKILKKGHRVCFQYLPGEPSR